MAWLKDLLKSKSEKNPRIKNYRRSEDSLVKGAFDSMGEEKFSPRQAEPGTATLFNQGYALYIEHVPTGYFVEFPAMLDSMSDAYMTNWVQEKVYGRMDPIGTFSDTNRALSLAWTVIAGSASEGSDNLEKINGLLSFLYPLYKEQGSGGGAILNMGPLIKIKFGNLVQNSETGGALMGFINGITFDPDIEGGMYTYTADGPMDTGGVEYIPKKVRLNLEMNVLHEHSLGWKNSGDGTFNWRGDSTAGFPYGSSNHIEGGVSGAQDGDKSVQKGFDPNTPAAAVNDRATSGN
jgi:hypothetical protein